MVPLPEAVPDPFDPPYDSPIERDFAWALSKYVAPEVRLGKQVWCKTICGDFRLDFLALLAGGLRIGLECDGKAYHGANRDEWRDAMLLGDNQVDAIIHLRGADLCYHTEDVLYVLAQLYREMFSNRGVGLLEQLASTSVITGMRWVAPGEATARYPEDPEVDQPASNLSVVCRWRNARETWPAWKRLYEFAKSVGGGRLEEVIELYRSAA